MGAAHSKKRRKEKKRRRSMSGSGLLDVDFDIPRSASVDVIRTLSVSSTTPCPHCPTLSSNRRTLSTPLEVQLDQRRQDFLDSTGMEQRYSVPRSLSDALTRNCHHHHHHHHHPHHNNHRFTAHSVEMMNSCPGMGDCYPGVATTLSHECLMPRDYRSHTTTAADMLECSTMSLNRNLAGRQSTIVQSRSSDFRDIERECYSSHDRREKSIELTPKRSSSFSPSSPHERRCYETRGGTQGVIDTFSPAHSSSSNPAAPSIVLTSPSPRESRQSHSQSDTQTDTQEGGSKLSLLDDEPSRLARWEKRKLMAQQLRMLRKHIQAQEEASSRSNPVPPPRPPLSLLSSNSGEDKNTVHKELDTPVHATARTSLPVTAHTSLPVTAQTSLPVTAQTLENNEPFCSLERTQKSDAKEMETVTTAPAPIAPQRRSSRSKFSKMSNYRYLDNHPVLSKLQNEQNNRLESMERRMRDIKISAMQEAERRRFAEIFPAKEDNTESEKLRLMQEARETLEVLKEEKKRKLFSNQTGENSSKRLLDTDSNTQQIQGTDTTCCTSDSGEVIPVRVVPSSSRDMGSQYKDVSTVDQSSKCSQHNEGKLSKQNSTEKQTDWLNEVWPNINLGQPFTWLLLPFMVFPVVLRMLLSFIITTTNTTNPSSSNNNNNSNTPSCSNSANTKNAITSKGSIRDHRSRSSPDLLRRRRLDEVKTGN